MRKTMILAGIIAILISPARAQLAHHVLAAHTQKTTDGVKLVFQTSAPYSLYFRRAPERLVIDFNDAELSGSHHFSAASPAILSASLRQNDLTHVQCELDLRYRIPTEAVEVSRQGDTLTVEVKLAYRHEETFALGSGLRWTRREVASGSRYLLWNELAVNPADPNVRIEVGLAKERLDTREKTTAMLARHHDLAGVNGGFFSDQGGPLGVVVRQGKLLAPHVDRRPARTVFGLMKNGTVRFARVTASKGELHTEQGDVWGEVVQALGAGPRLVSDGKVALTTDEEELGPGGNDISRKAARTVLALDRQGQLLVITVTGYRDNHSQGVSLEEMAKALVERGIVEAMNFDGGSSTTMAVGHNIVSAGPGAPRGEREVATALLLGDASPSSYPAQIRLPHTIYHLPADGDAVGRVAVDVLDSGGRPVADGTVVRFYPERLRMSTFAKATVGGRVTVEFGSVRSPGSARLRVEAGSARADLGVELQCGKPKQLYCQVGRAKAVEVVDDDSSTPAPAALQEVKVLCQVNDGWGNPVAGVSLMGGGVRILTGSGGQASFTVQAAAGGGTFTIQGDGIAPKTVAITPLKS